MELKDLQAFIDVAEHNSFTKAAEVTYISQPTLSKAVKKLENFLQVQLFDRSTRQLRLTDAGQIVYTHGKSALAALQEIPLLLDELEATVTGKIKIGVPPLIGTLFFPYIAKTFHENFPQVELELIEQGAKVIEKLVNSGEIDVGIVVLPVNDSLYNVLPFITDEFVLYVHENHPYAQRNDVGLSDLSEEQFIIFSKSFTLHEFIIQACEKEGFTPTISYESSQWDLILELVKNKLGITLLPKCIYQKHNQEMISLVPLKKRNLLWNLGIITKKNAYQSIALRKMLTMFEKEGLVDELFRE